MADDSTSKIFDDLAKSDGANDISGLKALLYLVKANSDFASKCSLLLSKLLDVRRESARLLIRPLLKYL